MTRSARRRMSCRAGCTVGGRERLPLTGPSPQSIPTLSADKRVQFGTHSARSWSGREPPLEFINPTATSIWAMVPSASGRNSPTDAAPHANASAARTTVPSLINQARLNQSIRPNHPRDPPCRTHVAPRIDSGHVRVVGSPASKIKTLDQTRAQLTIENTVARVPASAEAQWRGSLATASTIVPPLSRRSCRR